MSKRRTCRIKRGVHTWCVLRGSPSFLLNPLRVTTPLPWGFTFCHPQTRGQSSGYARLLRVWIVEVSLIAIPTFHIHFSTEFSLNMV
jgi:hypothetical protein